MFSQSSASICLLGFLSSSVSALALNSVQAEARAPNDILLNLAFPIPTPAPDNQDLRRRLESQRTLLVGPDATCGYFGGNATQPWGCTASSTCAFATPTTGVLDSTTTTAPGSVLCCDSASGCPTKPGPTSCVDKGRFDIKTACTGSCLEDERVLKCTSGIYIFCNTISFPTPSLSALFCNYISTYSPILAQTTFSGQGAREFTPTIQAMPAPTSSSLSSSVSPSSAVAETSAVTASSSPNSSAAASNADGEGGGKKKSNKGAVIGGVIGGVAGLVFLVAVLFLLLRWRNMKKDLGPVVGDEFATKDDVAAQAAAEPGAGKMASPSPASGSSEAVEKVEGSVPAVNGKKGGA
ncbi:hypothetical protein BKA65DRAFT_545309 [Rhexocercosporidium sp. MPI-PUGE-AT-0058]|nr:hypothetical protein BKA65DRAFT_545309 [Rhexocercosporidium sp. MPI-PUGE-AT-0058]